MSRRLAVLRGHLHPNRVDDVNILEMNVTSSTGYWNVEPNEKEVFLQNAKFATKVVSKGHISPLGLERALSTPIVASSTFELESADHGAALSSMRHVEGKSPYLYSRWRNPTTDAAASMITRLEGKGAFGTHLCATGMAAISTVLFSLLGKGDHIIVFTPVYGGTHEILVEQFPRFGIEVTWINEHQNKKNAFEIYSKLIKPNTKVIYCETPANPTISLADLKLVGSLGKHHNVTTVVDSTFASPYNQNPISYAGIDVVIHSCTKYLGGHSDITGGSITSTSEELHAKFFQQLKLFGGTLSPFESFLLARGIKTLDVRMKRHNENAQKIAEFLESHEKVSRVFYPGLRSHPQHGLACKQMPGGFGGMVCFEVKGGAESGKRVIENLKVITLAVSLGGVESLVEQASTMTHTMVSREERLSAGITDGLIRLSVGLEDPGDLMQDLANALKLA